MESYLLLESALGQDFFLKELYSLAKSRPRILGQISNLIITLIEENRLLDPQVSNNKKLRNKINITIHKELRKIKNFDGSSFNIKGLKPLYETIIDYVKDSEDINLDDCLLSADYFMKELYKFCSDEEKLKIENNEFDFNIVYKRTKFYERFLDNKTGIESLFKSQIKQVYEDENIKIVYPMSPQSFNKYISLQNVSVGWCTQSPITWYDYTDEHFVMILRDKRVLQKSPDYIVSLKVNFDGTVNFKETCDRYNSHMNEKSVRKIIDNDEIFRVIKQESQDIKLDFNIDPVAVLDNLESLIEIGDLNQTQNILNSCLTNIGNPNTLERIIEGFSKVSSPNVFCKVMSECITEIFFSVFREDYLEFDEPLMSDLFHLVADEIESKKVTDLFIKQLNENAIKNSHAKYFVTLCNYDYFEEEKNPASQISESILKKSLSNCLRSNNPIHFQSLVYSYATVISNVYNDISKDDEILNLFTKSNSWNAFIKMKEKDIYGTTFKSYPNLKESLINEMIKSSKDEIFSILKIDNKEKVKEFNLGVISNFIIESFPTFWRKPRKLDLDKLKNILPDKFLADEDNFYREDLIEKAFQVSNEKISYIFSLIEMMILKTEVDTSNKEFYFSSINKCLKLVSSSKEIFDLFILFRGFKVKSNLLNRISNTYGKDITDIEQSFLKMMSDYLFGSSAESKKRLDIYVNDMVENNSGQSKNTLSQNYIIVSQALLKNNPEGSVHFALALLEFFSRIKDNRNKVFDKFKEYLSNFKGIKLLINRILKSDNVFSDFFEFYESFIINNIKSQMFDKNITKSKIIAYLSKISKAGSIPNSKERTSECFSLITDFITKNNVYTLVASYYKCLSSLSKKNKDLTDVIFYSFFELIENFTLTNKAIDEEILNDFKKSFANNLSSQQIKIIDDNLKLSNSDDLNPALIYF